MIARWLLLQAFVACALPPALFAEVMVNVPVMAPPPVGRAASQSAPPAASDRLPIAVILQPRDSESLTALLAAQQNPLSPQYRKWLTPEQFATRFGAPLDDYNGLADWFREQGFMVRTWANRMRFDLLGTVEVTQKSLGV